MALTTIISEAKFNKMCEEEERSGREFLRYIKQVDLEADGYLYTVYEDERNGKRYATRTIRSVSMGFNRNDPGKEEEFDGHHEARGQMLGDMGLHRPHLAPDVGNATRRQVPSVSLRHRLQLQVHRLR